MYRKRCQGRLRKFLGDLCLLAGVPSEAIAHYQTASDILRNSADWLWLGGMTVSVSCSNFVLIHFLQRPMRAFAQQLLSWQNLHPLIHCTLVFSAISHFRLDVECLLRRK
jgi:hypothetical protein